MQTNGSHGFYPGRRVPWEPSLESVLIHRVINLIAFYKLSSWKQAICVYLEDIHESHFTWIIFTNETPELIVHKSGWLSPINPSSFGAFIRPFTVSVYEPVTIGRLISDNSYSLSTARNPIIAKLEILQKQRQHLNFLNSKWCVEHWLDLSCLQVNPNDKRIIAVWLNRKDKKQRIVRLLHANPNESLESISQLCWVDLKFPEAIINVLYQVGITSQPHAEIVARLISTNAPQEPVIY